MRLPELPPRLFSGLRALRQYVRMRIACVQHAQGIVACLRHSQRVIRFIENVQGLLVRRHFAVFGERSLGPANCRQIGTARVVVTRHVHFILRQGRYDVIHAQYGIGCVFGVGEAFTQLFKRLVRLFGRLLIALGQVLLCNRREQSEVVIEIDQTFQVNGVIQRRTGRVQLHEAVQRHNCLGRFTGAVLRVGSFHLGLLRQWRAGRARFQLFQHGDGFVPLAVGHTVFGIGINCRRTHGQGFVFYGVAAASAEEHSCTDRKAVTNSR